MRVGWQGWPGSGRESSGAGGGDRTNHQSDPLPEDNVQQLEAIVQQAEEELGNGGEFLSSEEVMTIHEVSMALLAKVGVAFHSNEAIAIFKEHGLPEGGRLVCLHEAHTVAGCRHAFWQPALSDRNGLETWLANGQPDVIQRASQRWRDLLTEHEDPPVDATTKRQLHGVFGRAWMLTVLKLTFLLVQQVF